MTSGFHLLREHSRPRGGAGSAAALALALAACHGEASPGCAPAPADLVELITLAPTIHLDIRYATAKNFIGRPVYASPRAFLQRPAALALVRAHQALARRGYGLLIFDGYRPWSVTKLFWDLTPPARRAFVADPAKGSIHNRGCAVDLSLYHLDTGLPAPMPSDYDEMSERASPGYRGGEAADRERRDLLRAAMEREGFVVQPNEWWHFNYRPCPRSRVLDLPFEALPPPPRSTPRDASPGASP